MATFYKKFSIWINNIQNIWKKKNALINSIVKIVFMDIPKTYIETRWEHREGFYYEHPFDYCNGVKLTFEILSDFENVFGVPFSKAQRESYAYNSALKESMYDSSIWKNNESREKAFEKIYHFNISGKSATGSSTTPLFPFEIYMMDDGFEMISFCELNSINPGISIVADKQVYCAYINPRGIRYSRCYKKGEMFVYIAFGIEIGGKKTNFYFGTDINNDIFQVNNDIANYEKAINGKLKSLFIYEKNEN